MTYWTCHQGASQEAFRNSHKRDLVGEPPGMGPRRFRKASCEATGMYLTKRTLTKRTLTKRTLTKHILLTYVFESLAVPADRVAITAWAHRLTLWRID